MARSETGRRGGRAARAPRDDDGLTEESAGLAWLRDFRLSGFALTVLGLLAAAIVILAPGLKTLVEQQQEIARLEQQVADAQDAVDDLTEQIARWDDPAYVESQARDRLYYVYPGDFAYIVVNGDQVATTDDGLPISDEIQSTEVDWLRAVLASVYEAGLTDAPPADLDSPGLLDSPVTG